MMPVKEGLWDLEYSSGDAGVGRADLGREGDRDEAEGDALVLQLALRVRGHLVHLQHFGSRQARIKHGR